MPHVGGNVIRGRLDGAWRAADTVWVRYGGAWKVADFVWVRYEDSWRVVWAKTQLAAESPSASLQADKTVNVSWDAPEPEVCDSYEVRRADGSLVATVAPNGGPYVVGDSLPLVGSHAYTIRAKLVDAADVDAATNSVAFGANPQNVTATANVGASRIEVSWDSGDDAVAEIRVYRPSGSLVGTLPGDATSINDESPGGDVDDGEWLVEFFTADQQSYGSAISNPLDVALKPDSVSAVEIGDVFEVTWSAPASAVTGWRVSKAVGGDWTVLTTLSAGSSTFEYEPSLSEGGFQLQFQVQAVFGPSISEPTNSGFVYVPPNPPSAVSLSPTGVVGQLTLTWGAPTSGTYQSYEVEYSENGSTWVGSSDDTSPSSRTFSGSSGSRYMRVRAESSGRYSAWVERGATPLWDTTPPGLPTITSLKPESQYGRLVFRFAVTDVTTEAYDFRYRVNNGSWNTVGWAFTSPGSYSLVVRSGSNFSSGDDVDCQIRVRDSLLNASAWSSSWRYKLKPEIQYVNASGTSHYRQGVWNYLGNNRVMQGYFSNPSFLYTGGIFYGENTVAAACDADGTGGGKIQVTGIAVRINNINQYGDSVENLYLGTITQYGEFGVPGVSNVDFVGQTTRGTTVWYWLQAAARDALVNKTASARGVSAYRNSTEYLGLAALSEDSLQGQLQIHSLG